MGIVKFQLSLLKSAKTVLVELPGVVTKSRSWSDEFWSYFDYECLFLGENFSINIVQEADDENENLDAPRRRPAGWCRMGGRPGARREDGHREELRRLSPAPGGGRWLQDLPA